MLVLPTPGGPHKAENLSFDISVEFTNCQQFQNTLLHLLQTVMLPVQHLACMGLVQVILGGNVPGQRSQQASR